MYGGFNGSTCQFCPMGSTNEGGYSVSSCVCLPGNTGPNGGPCTRKYFLLLFLCLIIESYTLTACPERSFKPFIGSSICQPCPNMTYSSVGSTSCLCISGYELSGLNCRGQCGGFIYFNIYLALQVVRLDTIRIPSQIQTVHNVQLILAHNRQPVCHLITVVVYSVWEMLIMKSAMVFSKFCIFKLSHNLILCSIP